MRDINFMVKYCGGCNSNYDRVEIVRKIQDKISVRIVPYDKEIIPDILLVVKGCKSECIDIDEYKSKYGVFVIEDEQDYQVLLEETINKTRNITSLK